MKMIGHQGKGTDLYIRIRDDLSHATEEELAVLSVIENALEGSTPWQLRGRSFRAHRFLGIRGMGEQYTTWTTV